MDITVANTLITTVTAAGVLDPQVIEHMRSDESCVYLPDRKPDATPTKDEVEIAVAKQLFKHVWLQWSNVDRMWKMRLGRIYGMAADHIRLGLCEPPFQDARCNQYQLSWVKLQDLWFAMHRIHPDHAALNDIPMPSGLSGLM